MPTALAAALGCAVSAPAAAQTAPGVTIENRATLSFQGAGETIRFRSNVDRVVVAERLDVVLAIVAPPVLENGRAILRVELTNGGTGTEEFLLSVQADGRVIAATFVPERDDAPWPGRTPPLAAGERVRFAAVLELDAAAPPAMLSVEARAATGSGAPGTVFGADALLAVVGPTGAEAEVSAPLVAGSAPQLFKRQEVPAVTGRRPRRGDEIVYTLEARFPGRAVAVAVEDAVPAGTRFVPGSLRLDDVALSDAADTDAGHFDGASVRVALGDVEGPATRIIRFRTIIQ